MRTPVRDGRICQRDVRAMIASTRAALAARLRLRTLSPESTIAFVVLRSKEYDCDCIYGTAKSLTRCVVEPATCDAIQVAQEPHARLVVSYYSLWRSIPRVPHTGAVRNVQAMKPQEFRRT